MSNDPPAPGPTSPAFQPVAQGLFPDRDRPLGLEGSEGPALLLGTKKGLFSVTSSADRSKWTLRGPMFLGHIIHHAVQDPRDPRRILLAMRTGHLGPTVFRTDDAGATWKEATRPPAFAKAEPGTPARTVDQVFWLTPGHASERDTWYAGTSPEALFRSEDSGDTWEPVSGWNDHPSWWKWNFPENDATPDGNPLHSVRIDPRDPQHVYLATSEGGVFESTDGCKDWRPLNENVLADFKPEPYPEYGQDTHCLELHPAAPDVLWQQNHCGIYRLERPAEKWDRVGDNMPEEVGDIGFGIVMHPRDADTVWVFPMDGSDVWPRTSPDGRPAVYRTRDAGQSWQRCDRGLPDEHGWFTVYRQALAGDTRDPVGVYFGTTGGEVWASPDEGDHFVQIAAHLPQILSVTVVERA